MFLPKRITQCRKKLGMSQERFMGHLASDGLNISRPTLTSWEKGITSPPAKELAILIQSTGFPVTYFFDLKHNKTSYASKYGHSKAVRV